MMPPSLGQFKKSSSIVLSTLESEYTACVTTVQEVVWLGKFLRSLEVVPHVTDLLVIFCDRMAELAYFKTRNIIKSLSP